MTKITIKSDMEEIQKLKDRVRLGMILVLDGLDIEELKRIISNLLYHTDTIASYNVIQSARRQHEEKKANEPE